MPEDNPIKKWLREHNFSQSWLARQLGVKRQTVSRWVNGVSNPRPEAAYALQELTDGDLTVEILLDPRNVGRTWAVRPTVTPARH